MGLILLTIIMQFQYSKSLSLAGSFNGCSVYLKVAEQKDIRQLVVIVYLNRS